MNSLQFVWTARFPTMTRFLALFVGASFTIVSGYATPPGGVHPGTEITPRALHTTVVRLKQDAELSRAFPPAIPPMGAPGMGGKPRQLDRIRILVIPVRCRPASPDSGVPISTDQLKELFFGDLLRATNGERASVADYFRAASFGAVTSVTGEVVDWITLSDPFWSYVQPSYASQLAPFPARKFYNSTLSQLQNLHKIKFRDFDDDGRDPNPAAADDDGYVDIVVFISGDREVNRGYRWQLSFVGDGEAFSPGQVGSWESEETTTALRVNGTTQNDVKVKVDDFAMIPFADVIDGRIGVVCHELFHCLGLPDLYGRSDDLKGGVGSWCIMGRGCLEATPNSAGSRSARWPALPSAACRYYLGWGKFCECAREHDTAIAGMRDNGTYTIIAPEETPTGDLDYQEVFFVESYSSATDKSPWGKSILPEGAAGYLVWHADGQVGRTANNGIARMAWPFAEMMLGQNDVSYAEANFAAPSFPRPLVRCVQADGRLDIEKGTNFADLSDLFTDGNTLSFDSRAQGFTWYRHPPHTPKIAFAPNALRASFPASTSAIAIPSAAPPVAAPIPSSATATAAPAPPPERIGLPMPQSRIGGRTFAPAIPGTRMVQSAAVPSSPAMPIPAIDFVEDVNRRVPALLAQWDEITANNEVPVFRSPEARKELAVRVELNAEKAGPAKSVLSDEVITALKVISSRDLEKEVPLLDKLSAVSSDSIDAVSASLNPETALKLNDTWKEQRTYTLKRKGSALAALNEKAADATRDFIRGTKASASKEEAPAMVRAPDSDSVQELRRLNLPPVQNAETALADAGNRISDFNKLAGLGDARVTLKIEPPAVESGFGSSKNGGHRFQLSYVAKIGDREIPLAPTTYWGVVKYDDKNHLQGIRFNKPVRIGELPQSVAPRWTDEQAVDFVRQRLGSTAPPKDTIIARLELCPVGPDEQQHWELAYRVALPLPNGATNDIYLNADTGARIK